MVPAVCKDAWKEIDPGGQRVSFPGRFWSLVPCGHVSPCRGAGSPQQLGWYCWHAPRAARLLVPSAGKRKKTKPPSISQQAYMGDPRHLGSWDTYALGAVAHIHMKPPLTQTQEMETGDNTRGGRLLSPLRFPQKQSPYSWSSSLGVILVLSVAGSFTHSGALKLWSCSFAEFCLEGPSVLPKLYTTILPRYAPVSDVVWTKRLTSHASIMQRSLEQKLHYQM